MATDTAQSIDSRSAEASDEAYVSPLADFLLIAVSVSVLALGAASVIVF